MSHQMHSTSLELMRPASPELKLWDRFRRIASVATLCVASLAITSTASAGAVDNTGPFAMLTGQLQGRGEGEALFLWEHASQKLVVYLVSGKQMEVLFVRDCSFDFKANVAVGVMIPTVADMKKVAEEARATGKVTPASASIGPKTGEPGSFTLTLGRLPGGTGDLLYVFGHNQKRLAVYSIRGNQLELMFLRDSENDLVPRSMGKTIPTPASMKEKIKQGAESTPKKNDRTGSLRTGNSSTSNPPALNPPRAASVSPLHQGAQSSKSAAAPTSVCVDRENSGGTGSCVEFAGVQVASSGGGWRLPSFLLRSAYSW